jgi:Spy/CpxP family protein refolding chaperone
MYIKRLTLGLVCVFGLSVAVSAERPSAGSQSGATSKPASTQTPAQPAASQKPGPGGPASGQPDRKPWWGDEKTKKELGLTADQAKTIDQIYTSTKDELTGYWDAFQRENKELDRLISESKVEQWVVLRQIEKTEAQRSNFNKLRMMTLYRMHRVLTPEQRTKLQEILDRQRRDGRKQL